MGARNAPIGVVRCVRFFVGAVEFLHPTRARARDCHHRGRWDADASEQRAERARETGSPSAVRKQRALVALGCRWERAKDGARWGGTYVLLSALDWYLCTKSDSRP